MSTATEHSRDLLAAIIPNRRDLLDQAIQHVTVDQIPDPSLRDLYQFLIRYCELTGAIMPRSALPGLCRSLRVDAGQMALYEEVYDHLAERNVDEAGFRWAIEQVRELAAERVTRNALTQGMEILTRGVETKAQERLYGHRDARTFLVQQFGQIERDLARQDSPEGNMLDERDEILADYAARAEAHRNQRSMGIEFGIPPLDAKVCGLQNGDLILIVGYTSEGKTSCCVQLSWHAATQQGRNVVFLTTETLRPQVRRRIVARHSCLDRFGIPGGLNSRDIKNGTLGPEQTNRLAAVVADLTGNPDYGTIYIVQVPRSASIAYLETQLMRLQRSFSIDLVVMDYLALLKPDRRRASDREELGNILREAKQLATTFDGGRGIPFVSPWQVSRAARLEAQQTNGYRASALSETAEASNSPDIIVSLLKPVDGDDARHVSLRMQVMKHRDGERANAIEVNLDYATSRFSVGHREQESTSLWVAAEGL